MFEKEIDFLNKYEAWKLEQRMGVPYNDTPEKYLQELKNVANQDTIDKALAFIEKYEKGAPWPADLISELVSILRDEKK